LVAADAKQNDLFFAVSFAQVDPLGRKWVAEGQCRLRKGHAVISNILGGFDVVPFELNILYTTEFQ
jgi:hypothetical protein